MRRENQHLFFVKLVKQQVSPQRICFTPESPAVPYVRCRSCDIICVDAFTSSFDLRHSLFLKGDMIYLYATLLLLTNIVAWMANVFMLPGNWVLVAVAALYAFVLPGDAQPR